MQPVSGLVPRVLRQFGLAADLDGWRAVSDWPAVVGERIALRTRAVRFRQGTLYVEVDGSAWLHELGFLRRELVERLNRHLGGRPVRDIRFMTRGGTLR